MSSLKKKFEQQLGHSRIKVKNFVSDYGDKVIGETNLRQLYSGMRGMLSMITETSKLDPNEELDLEVILYLKSKMFYQELKGQINHYLKEYFISC